MKKIACFDNGGESLDRFTLISLDSGDMIGASERPFSPLGFGQYCGNPAWDYFARTVGVCYMRGISDKDPKHYRKIIKQKTAEIVADFKNEGALGHIVDFETLPLDVQQFAKQSF